MGIRIGNKNFSPVTRRTRARVSNFAGNGRFGTDNLFRYRYYYRLL